MYDWAYSFNGSFDGIYYFCERFCWIFSMECSYSADFLLCNFFHRKLYFWNNILYLFNEIFYFDCSNVNLQICILIFERNCSVCFENANVSIAELFVLLSFQLNFHVIYFEIMQNKIFEKNKLVWIVNAFRPVSRL